MVGARGVDLKTCSALVPATKEGVYEITTKSLTKPTKIGGLGYTPRNKKLLTAPYCYFNISNNAGSSVPYNYEDFSQNTFQFKVEGTFGASGNTKAIPVNYKKFATNENALDYSISGAKFPICSWKSDSYTNWLTQNAVNMQTEWTGTAISGGLTMLGSAYQGGLLGFGSGVISAVGDLIGTAREQHMAKTRANMIPDQVKGNLNAGDFVWAKYRSMFTYLPMSIKEQQARIIDEYFDQFGYKCNRVKIPNINGRRNWNFVKTVGCYIEANIPQDDLQEIKSMFDRGITFWHNPATFADYSQSNDIV